MSNGKADGPMTQKTTSPSKPLPCWRCHGTPTVEGCYGWTVACSDCFDGAPDAGPVRNEIGWGVSEEKAVEHWNDIMADREAER